MKQEPEGLVERVSLLMRGNFRRALEAFRSDTFEQTD